MTEQVSLDVSEKISEKFSGKIQKDQREGYEGFIVNNEILLDLCFYLRDDLGFDFLSSLTGVDYYPDNLMEVVYHLYNSANYGKIVFKVQTTRDEASVASIVPVYQGADLQEREAWDLLGIKFVGHPDLRRVLMWEGFDGHPLRKDWHEAYFEEEIKPLKSRYPEGTSISAEDKTDFKDNIKFPADFDLEQWTPQGDEPLYDSLLGVHKSEKGLKTERIIVNLGPQHPSTHGVFRMVVVLDGETIVDLKPVMGYLHRNHEKIGERNTYIQNMPFTDRLDYISSMSNNFGYALAVEKLMGIKPTERAEYIRVIMAELTRISSHVMNIGFLLNDLGAFFTPALYALKERELILDIFEEVSGSRMMCNYFRFGGVVRDISPESFKKIKDLVDSRLEKKIDELDQYLTDNEILRSRCIGVGRISATQALNMSVTGPILRASGVPYDVRKAEPYGIYDRFDFDVPVRQNGDVFDRYIVRLQEIRQSIRILKQAIKDIPEGPVMAGKSQYLVRVPQGEAYGRVEGPKGELGFYVVSNGKSNPLRYHVRAPSFINLTSLSKMCTNQKIADAVVILGAMDIVLGEVDR